MTEADRQIIYACLRALKPRAAARLVAEGITAAREGRASTRRLYRVVRPSVCGGASALHAGAEYRWGVQGEALWTDRRLAGLAAEACLGEVQDVTLKYTGSL